jgi:serine/threonine protein kinase
MLYSTSSVRKKFRLFNFLREWYNASMEAIRANADKLITPETIRETAIARLLEFEQEEFFIDKGGAAKVYELPAGYCLKVINDCHEEEKQGMFLPGNTPHKEAMIQQQMSQTLFTGSTRTPAMFGVLSADKLGDTNAIIMERLNAVNLLHVINGTAEVPDGFDIQTFFKDLEAYTQHMHTHEKIVHMDLYARNIMIDNETAMPRVIDFGRAVRTTDTTPEVQARTNEDRDWETLDKAFNALDKIL